MLNQRAKGYWYLPNVKKMMLNGTASPTMAWVEGIPYSRAHFASSLTTGGISGRGHRTISFIP